MAAAAILANFQKYCFCELKHYKERKTTFYKIKTLSSELQIKKNSCQTLGPEGKMVINDW
jgi:hypothetical protein